MEQIGRDLICDIVLDLPGDAEQPHEDLSHDSKSPGQH
jgi:hypothetical protein